MGSLKNIKIILSVIYVLIIGILLWFFFKYFSIDDFTSYELIKQNQASLDGLKDTNIFLLSIIFILFCCFWCLLLGFGSPIFLIGGFIFGKWLGSILVILGLSCGATLLYLLGSFFLKNLIEEKFSYKFEYLIHKFKKNEFLYFVVYRAIGGIPFFLQNLLPLLFNIKLKNYFFGTIIGLAPQLFIGTSLGAGISKVIESNSTPPTLFEMLITPDIYLPIIALITIFILAFIFRKKFFANK
tara:strand:- start:672 stop:1394 length:723 start_codon:yes stop_codon:yes gene_type:complete